jgi:hypothetical protein
MEAEKMETERESDVVVALAQLRVAVALLADHGMPLRTLLELAQAFYDEQHAQWSQGFEREEADERVKVTLRDVATVMQLAPERCAAPATKALTPDPKRRTWGIALELARLVAEGGELRRERDALEPVKHHVQPSELERRRRLARSILELGAAIDAPGYVERTTCPSCGAEAELARAVPGWRCKCGAVFQKRNDA